MVLLAGCGGDDPKAPKAAATREVAKPDDPLVRIALSAVRVVDPNDCRRWYEGGKAVKLCQDYVAAGSLQAQAQPRTIERSGDKAVVTVAESGGSPVALLLRQSGGDWRVRDSPNLLPAAN